MNSADVPPAVGIFIKGSSPPLLSVIEGLFTFCFVSYLCSLSTYDIVITTYSLLAKEIPTQKEEGVTPSANPSVGKVSLGATPHNFFF